MITFQSKLFLCFYFPGELQTREQSDVQQTKNAEQEESYKVKKRTIDLLPDAENNIAKLQVRVVRLLLCTLTLKFYIFLKILSEFI